MYFLHAFRFRTLITLFLFFSLIGSDLNAASISVNEDISADTTWSGNVLITDRIEVLAGAILTILPGTRVEFQHYRGYRDPQKRLSLIIKGAIVANGTDANPIYFSSDAVAPQNGDWSMVRLIPATGQTDSSFHYCVFEFAQHGLNVWDASPDIFNSVFRWNNWEGLYFESNCNPSIQFSQIYENGYNGMAAEQMNNIGMDNCEVWRNGTNGIHVDNSTLLISRSIVRENGAHGLSVDNNTTLTAYGVAIHDNSACGVGFGDGINSFFAANLDFKTGNGPGGDICGPVTWETSVHLAPSSPISLGFTPRMDYALGYIPGDQVLDSYMYIYPDDETRLIKNKIGAGLGLTWSVAHYNNAIWTVTLWGEVSRLNPVNGTVLDSFTLNSSTPGAATWGAPSQPWGMTFDDQGKMWLVDFAERKVFKINTSTQSIELSFDTPNPSSGGCKGLTWDGTYLNIMGWVNPEIYQMSRTGNLIKTITLDNGGNGGLAWDGKNFWVPTNGRILKYDHNGNAIGWIYAASEGTWDLSWDGDSLWATQRTNENWPDAKIYQLEILEDHDPSQNFFWPMFFPAMFGSNR